MATFVIIPVPPIQRETLDKVIVEKFGNAAYQLPQGEWFVSFQGTSKQLSDELGVSEGNSGSAIILGVGPYWGRANKDVWEWLEVNQK